MGDGQTQANWKGIEPLKCPQRNHVPVIVALDLEVTVIDRCDDALRRNVATARD